MTKRRAASAKSAESEMPDDETVSSMLGDFEALPVGRRMNTLNLFLRRAAGLEGVKGDGPALPTVPTRESKLSALTPEDLEALGDDVGRIAEFTFEMRNLLKQIEEVEVGGILALCAQIGFLADRVALKLDNPPVCGSLENWSEL